MVMKNYELNEQSRNKLLDHLASKPWNEVYELMAILLTLPETVSNEQSVPSNEA